MHVLCSQSLARLCLLTHGSGSHAHQHEQVRSELPPVLNTAAQAAGLHRKQPCLSQTCSLSFYPWFDSRCEVLGLDPARHADNMDTSDGPSDANTKRNYPAQLQQQQDKKQKSASQNRQRQAQADPSASYAQRFRPNPNSQAATVTLVANGKSHYSLKTIVRVEQEPQQLKAQLKRHAVQIAGSQCAA